MSGNGSQAREDLSEFRMTNVERALNILELLAEHPDGLGTSEISRLMELPKNFVFRATGVLHAKGYLQRDDGSKRFLLSRKLLGMGYSVLQESSLIEQALPAMRVLRDQVKETVVLTAMIEGRGMVLEHVPTTHPFRYVVETGMQFELHASAPGKAIMACLGKEDLDPVLDGLSFQGFTPHTITSRKGMLEELAQIRAKGFAYDRAEQFEGIHCVSAAVLDQTKRPVAALVVTGPSYRLPLEMLDELGEKVRTAALTLSETLGCVKENGHA